MKLFRNSFKHSGRVKWYLIGGLAVLLGFFGYASVTVAWPWFTPPSNVPDYTYGGSWFVLGAERLGSHNGWCAPNETKFRVAVKEYNANTSLTDVKDLRVEVMRLPGKTVVNTTTGVPETSPVCVDFEREVVFVDFKGGSDYVDHDGGHRPKPAAVDGLKGEEVTAHMHARPRSRSPGHGIKLTSPINGGWINYDPSFKFTLEDVPARFMPLTKLFVDLEIAKLGSGSNVWWDIPINPNLGGTHEISPKRLPDGLYQWNLMIATNNFAAIGGTAQGSSGNVMGSRPSFGIDTADPQNDLITHNPAPVTAGDNVELKARFQDTLSGLASIEIYFDGTKEKTCTFSGTTSKQTCTVNVGSFPGGSSHTYYAEAQDVAGNVTTTSDQNFTVQGTGGGGGGGNGPPTAGNVDGGSVYDGGTTPIDVSGDVSDPDGDPLEITNKTVPLDGTVSITDDLKMSYTNTQGTPYGDNGSPDTFKYQVSDGNGGTATGTVEVDVRYCRDGNLDRAREKCEPPDTKSCTDFGFTGGQATCNNNCEWDKSSCNTVCSDGMDNDGDGVKDADDPGCWTDPNDSSTYDSSGTSENNCGNGVCEPTTGEDPNSCPADCELEFQER